MAICHDGKLGAWQRYRNQIGPYSRIGDKDATGALLKKSDEKLRSEALKGPQRT